MVDLKQSAIRSVMVKMYLASDHVTPATGKTLTVTVSKNGGAFASGSSGVAELSAGWYSVALTATDTNTLGDLVVRCTAAACDDGERVFNVVAYDGQSATNLGLSNLDTTVASRLATAGYTIPPTVVEVRTEMDTNSTKLANLDAAMTTRATPAQVRTEIAGELNAASTELAAIPSTTGSLRSMLQFLFAYFRNRRTVTNTAETLFKEDAATALASAVIADDGTTFTKGELN